jgi:hypothetical protein
MAKFFYTHEDVQSQIVQSEDKASLETQISRLWRGSGGTYVEVVVRDFGLEGRSHCNRGFGGGRDRSVVFVKSSSQSCLRARKKNMTLKGAGYNYLTKVCPHLTVRYLRLALKL